MNKVLITLDYNITAQKVAEKGFSLALKMAAEVILLHVIADETHYSEIEYSQRTGNMGFSAKEASHLFDDGMKKAMYQFLDKIKQQFGNDAIQTIVKVGDFAESIIKTAAEKHVDIIVMGSHSQRWLEEVLIGSVTEKVLHHTSIPLFIVPTKKSK
jgi:nucleotide-binding universal stress UspA family protein